MSAYQRNVLVGIVVLVGLAMLGWMVLQFANKAATFFLTSGTRITLNTPRAEGIADGSPVTYRGVNVGRVTGVRYVRLLALGAQDAGSPTVDVRELKVFGVGPNVAPSGTLSVEAPRNFINGVVRFRATFTDPDSTILRYLWDFDGDGTWDQQTQQPSVSHVWQGAGTYHVVVGARDFVGDLGTAAIDLRVIDPNQPVEAIPQRKPLITFDPPDGIDLSARIACTSKCRFTAKLVMSRALARRLHSRHRTVLTLKKSTEGPGLGSWTVQMLAFTGQGRLDQLPAGDLAYVKLVGRLRSGGDPRVRATEEEVSEFFAPYGSWAGLAGLHALRAAGSSAVTRVAA